MNGVASTRTSEWIKSQNTMLRCSFKTQITQENELSPQTKSRSGLTSAPETSNKSESDSQMKHKDDTAPCFDRNYGREVRITHKGVSKVFVIPRGGPESQNKVIDKTRSRISLIAEGKSTSQLATTDSPSKFTARPNPHMKSNHVPKLPLKKKAAPGLLETSGYEEQSKLQPGAESKVCIAAKGELELRTKSIGGPEPGSTPNTSHRRTYWEIKPTKGSETNLTPTGGSGLSIVDQSVSASDLAYRTESQSETKPFRGPEPSVSHEGTCRMQSRITHINGSNTVGKPETLVADINGSQTHPTIGKESEPASKPQNITELKKESIDGPESHQSRDKLSKLQTIHANGADPSSTCKNESELKIKPIIGSESHPTPKKRSELHLTSKSVSELKLKQVYGNSESGLLITAPKRGSKSRIKPASESDTSSTPKRKSRVENDAHLWGNFRLNT